MKTIYVLKIRISPKDSPSLWLESEHVVESYQHAQHIAAKVADLRGKCSVIPHNVSSVHDVCKSLMSQREGY